MKNDLHIKDSIVIPEDELIISASRSGGAGGQHVNKTSSRITVQWNVRTTRALSEEQKHRVLEKLHAELSNEGEVTVHHSSSRSQFQNKKAALDNLAEKIRRALHVPKKRLATGISKGAKEKRLQSKRIHSTIKKMRSKKDFDD
jgi:ribosome-associated protein